MKVKINNRTENYRCVWFEPESGIIKIINQNKLPHKFEIAELKTYMEAADAIKTMAVRGAPAIGVTAGFGIAQACVQAPKQNFTDCLGKAVETLKSTRPTAVNLFHVIGGLLNKINDMGAIEDKEKAIEIAVFESQKTANETIDACKKIGEFGNGLFKNKYKILTHCNAGALACVDFGTALSPMRIAKYAGKEIFVFVDETRPRLQGAKLTAWELLNEGIEHKIIADNASGYFMQKGEIDLCIVGADRITANGDVANKIGTYEKAVLAKENSIPFYVAAPVSTIDFNIQNSNQIPIEERSEDDVLTVKDNKKDIRIAPVGSHALNPAFDVTPAKYITGIITEIGIFRPEEIHKLTNAGQNKNV
ncbi:MAG: S-methyl-5-thioribose-1-phosphate isomerase [Candidatus Altiarchaeum hamiconexum]|uniref:Putative methylthioribose-1-phosphate isomerase n=1 Tax=Candidatus Altarchaeum hamiconexum TaxID=1803513 RepID=A0A8J7YZB0_9ARCH|nr:S-methyl-5-thioribose-1-phosphate isomerase [Candidatus Altarchaeum hamiconexum]OIQ04849.1 MAG: S-methyl-5-thioribose-1-phosphate isomerase [Candidatus Altarchaeum sp. CG2_30_32_3053]PIN67249.1 MAG: S-methyl-5-thioribose-1-phosphate isomerase [Candidatus Altarchaeum sp. CG12_big_fil_rev_8_21_14_0_65_33_22]PIV27201.1 MAG: S-methyl-5-thioribose-1-phosphate isomerase [Candidatus Altarchaeum sp. CG03_land_8_20_14_0_80_32_618]PIX49465.1 MAG: S-methyl-5-thioribose-1-phosphate isomerase [Candidatus